MLQTTDCNIVRLHVLMQKAITADTACAFCCSCTEPLLVYDDIPHLLTVNDFQFSFIRFAITVSVSGMGKLRLYSWPLYVIAIVSGKNFPSSYK